MSRVRRAVEEDAPAIARVHIAAWQAGYRGQLPDAYLDAMDPAAREEGWRTGLAGGGEVRLGPENGLALIVENDSGDVAGICCLGRYREAADSSEEVLGEVWMINLEPSSWGTGLARELFAAATAELVTMGFKEAVLWVLHSNGRARQFYANAGWHHDGAEKLEPRDGFDMRELRYRRSLA
ncbi:MAG: GNAT family N-acetyltransferase [Acidimicrobiales bacterium]